MLPGELLFGQATHQGFASSNTVLMFICSARRSRLIFSQMTAAYFSFIFFKGWANLLFLFALTSIFFVSYASAAIDISPNFKQCWKYETGGLTNIQPIRISNGVVFTLSDASLISLDSQTGAVNWKAALGGEIAATPVSNGKIIVAVTRAESNAEKVEVNSVFLRALSSETGLTIWQKTLPAAASINLILNGETVIIAFNESETSADLLSLEIANGNSVWNKKIPSEITTKIHSFGTQIIFGTKDNSIRSISLATGETSKQHKIKSAAQNSIVVADGNIFYGNARGEIVALRATDSQQIWSLKTGGAIQDILPTSRGLLITSLDNFVYLHKFSNGKRQWRRRLAARPLNAELLNQENALLLVNGENAAIVLDLKKGRILNQVLFGDDNYAVAAAETADKFLFVPTFQGILCFVPSAVACGGTSENENEKSAKI